MVKVVLLSHTPEPEKVVAAAAKVCYSHNGVENIYDKLDNKATESFINMLSDLGHESPTEHVSFTFGIEGVSRSLLAQITRHRIASYSVKSQRYVTEGDFEYIIPPEIETDPDALKIFKQAMESDKKSYNKLADILKSKHEKAFLAEGKSEKEAAALAEKKAIEDARYVLSNACETKMVATFNTRSLMNFFRHRLCERAQWEIRELADKMYHEVIRVAPNLFKTAGPPCVTGPCHEGKMSCGQMIEKRKIYGAERKQ